MTLESLPYGHHSENEKPELKYKSNNIFPLSIVNADQGQVKLLFGDNKNELTCR